MIDQRPVGLVTHCGNQRDGALRRCADDDLLVKAPQILKATATPSYNQEIGPVRHGIETANGGGDFSRRRLALNSDRPDQYVARKAIVESVQDIMNDCARG